MALLETSDNFSYEQLIKWLPYDDVNKNPASLLITRGLNKDYNWNINEKPKSNDTVNDNSVGTKLYKELHNGRYPQSIVGKIHAITLESPKGSPPLTSRDSDYANFDYHKTFQKFSDICDKKRIKESQLENRPDLEYYPEDFLYSSASGYPLNRLITLRRFPYACIDNIGATNVQSERDVTRMVTFFDDQTNRLEEILGFSYGLRWKSLEAQMESNRMYGGDQEGLTGFMKTGALALGDSELIKNRLRGPVGNEVDPTADNNRVYGPVDSITSTHIRDVGFDFDKEFSLKFSYKSKSFGGRNPDSVMKDIMANVLLCTYNDGDFWPGSRFWVGARPSKSINRLKWMNSDNPNVILEGAWNSMLDFVQKRFGSPDSALETLKNIVKGGVQMLMANILNNLGRPGMVQANSLLSNEPVGLWHITVGHPMNPILTMGDLLCTGVEVGFPDDTLSYGDFPTSIDFTVKLKPAKPRDRAGIEMMFNHGSKRIYMPTVVTVQRDPTITSTKRGLWDKYVVDPIDRAGVVVKRVGGEVVNDSIEIASDINDQIKYSVSAGISYAQVKHNDMKVWIAKQNQQVVTPLVTQAGDAIETKLIQVNDVAKNIKNTVTDLYKESQVSSLLSQ